MALVAGFFQIIASIALGLASLERFTSAADERPAIYMVMVVLISAGALAVWIVRERLARYERDGMEGISLEDLEKELFEQLTNSSKD